MTEPNIPSSEERPSGIMRITDKSRSPEFKGARDVLLQKIGKTLEELRGKAESGEPLANGMVIKPGAGVEQTVVTDPMEDRPRFNLGMTKYPDPGAYMLDDGLGHCKFTMVEASGRIIEIEEDGMERSMHGPESGYSSSSSTTLSRFKEELVGGGGYTEVLVDASGEVRHKYFDAATGFNTSTPISSPEDVQMLEAHFEQVTAEILPPDTPTT